MKVGSDGRIHVTDLVAGGLHILRRDATVDGFVACGAAPTNYGSITRST